MCTWRGAHCAHQPLPRAPAQTGLGEVKPMGAPWYGVVRHGRGIQDPSVGHSGRLVLQSGPQRIKVIRDIPGRRETRQVVRMKVEVRWFDSQVSQIKASPFCVLPPHPAPQGRMTHIQTSGITQTEHLKPESLSVSERTSEKPWAGVGRLSGEGSGKLQPLRLQPRSAANGALLVWQPKQVQHSRRDGG